MWSRDVVFISLLLSLVALAVSAFGADNGPVLYAPDVVGVGRMFVVKLRVPVDADELQLDIPEFVSLLDRTPLPADESVRRYWFKSRKPADTARILFHHPGGEVPVDIQVWSFEDLQKQRELGGWQLPRRWPLGEKLPELKSSQTITTDAQKRAARANGPTPAHKIGLEDLPNKNHPYITGADQWLKVTPEQIWSAFVDTTIARWPWVNLQEGCPVHGRKIYEYGSYYPWIRDRSLPYSWKIVCPVGNEAYPSNDFGAGDMTSGNYSDDGISGGCLVDGTRYGFIATICRAYCLEAQSIAPACANGYLATGDMRYVHRALVAMCRMAAEYAYLGTMVNHRQAPTWPTKQETPYPEPLRFEDATVMRLYKSGFITSHHDQPKYQRAYAEAYDKIWPAIDEDPDIIPFLQEKGFDIQTHEDVRRFIEQNLFATWIQGTFDGACYSNPPSYQRGFARIAEMLNYENGTDFMDWLYDGTGRMRTFLPNSFFRDGSAYESTNAYNKMHVISMAPIIDSISHMRQMRPEVYPEEAYPRLGTSHRYHNVFDFVMDAVTIDRYLPEVGDSIHGFPRYDPKPPVAFKDAEPATFEHAYRLFEDPKFAWALANTPEWEPSVDFPYSREHIEAEAAKWPDDFRDASSLHDGYGLAIMRGGKGEHKRALWLGYGMLRGHWHDDIMQLGLHAYGDDLLRQFGYPRNWGFWERVFQTHNVARQLPLIGNVTDRITPLYGTARLFAEAGDVHLGEIHGQGYIETEDEPGYRLLDDSWQRRMAVLVDVDDEDFYCMDLYRVHGGEDHWWSFHVTEGEFETEGIELTEQETGTLAGPDVPYGDTEWLEAHGCELRREHVGYEGRSFGFPHFYNVARGTPSGPWYADWTVKEADDLHVRLHVPQADGSEVVFADGTSPALGSPEEPNPFEMRFAFLHNSGDGPLETNWINVIDPYKETPVVQSARRLEVSGTDEAGFGAMGCIVETAGRTDTILASADPGVERTAEGDITFTGRFGFISESGGAPEQMTLVGGTRLQKGDFSISLDEPGYEGAIVATDPENRTITIAPAPEIVDAMVGQYVFVHNEVRRVACSITDARRVVGGAELTLRYDPLIGYGRVTGVSDHRLDTDSPFRLDGYRYYHGAHLVNAAGDAGYQLLELNSGGPVVIDSDIHPEATGETLAKQFPENTWFRVYAFGVGDAVSWPYTISLQRSGPASYRLSAPKKVNISLPADVTVEQE